MVKSIYQLHLYFEQSATIFSVADSYDLDPLVNDKLRGSDSELQCWLASDTEISGAYDLLEYSVPEVPLAFYVVKYQNGLIIYNHIKLFYPRINKYLKDFRMV